MVHGHQKRAGRRKWQCLVYWMGFMMNAHPYRSNRSVWIWTAILNCHLELPHYPYQPWHCLNRPKRFDDIKFKQMEGNPTPPPAFAARITAFNVLRHKTHINLALAVPKLMLVYYHCHCYYSGSNGYLEIDIKIVPIDQKLRLMPGRLPLPALQPHPVSAPQASFQEAPYPDLPASPWMRP